MIPKIGDIVAFFSDVSGHEKYHICVSTHTDSAAAVFLYINSEAKSGYDADCILNDGRIPGLPKSRTGKSIVSFSQLARANERKLKLYKARKIGVLPVDVARELESFAETVQTLPQPDKKIVLSALRSIK
jgi:hypothetical protein